MTTAWLKGDTGKPTLRERIQSQGLSDYLCRPTENYRNRRRHSNFWRGLYGLNWIAAYLLCIELVDKIIRLHGKNQVFYQRGLKAIKLIQQPL